MTQARSKVKATMSALPRCSAVLDNIVLAEYRDRYDWRERKVKDIR